MICLIPEQIKHDNNMNLAFNLRNFSTEMEKETI